MRTREERRDHGQRQGTHNWRGSARGQALVEFALVAPLLFLLIFGIFEFSLINASIGAYNFAAKDSARLGSLLGNSDANVDSEMIALIRSHVVGLVPATIQKIEIYRSDEAGDYSTTAEDVYNGSGNPIGTGTWPPSLRNDQLANADYLGVRITYQYTYITAFIAGLGTKLTLIASSVQRIEPQDYEGSRGGVRDIVLRSGRSPGTLPAPGAGPVVASDLWKGDLA